MYSVFSELLQNSNIKAADVAKATGISTGSLSDWKNGRSNPKPEKLKKIADYFGVSVDYLMGINSETDNKIQLSNEEMERLHVFKANDKLRILFDETQKLEPSDIDFVLAMVERLKTEGKIN